MGDLTDRYVIANLLGCAVALVVHVAVQASVFPVFAAFALFVPTFFCFGATMVTHPEARVSRIGPIVVGVRIDFGSLWRTVPWWALAGTASFLAYLVWFFLSHRVAMTRQEPPTIFAALFAGICAHLLWSGVGTRIGALRLLRARAQAV